ncbi:hypothetical protein CNEO2_110001 [Clostridium neonatale]|uniref:Uncharacterized protein n=1 Tax=Clostridium neonatale TaxID=137838 RepID=A0AAD1YCQ5_9CLOT|nr:hypothetical protein CNEO2_1200002 [Clostridium neonatale]CAI3197884.1 hypothetical protein CNEO2_230063 [Clostridium neonatale]CAI3212217.1 hypothetical protein CNEO2_40195 [Clostridium neonatale]CAI3212458.1 hypothetical protein CNEO2_70001 [Clostridium neonatale]CAI3216276.1 hypothetical protein CNEO2_90001 [Clostridium neonatale]
MKDLGSLLILCGLVIIFSKVNHPCINIPNGM